MHIDGPDGPSDLKADYLVGCDGAHSVVRTAAGIGSPGTPANAIDWLGDVVLDDPPAPGSNYFGPDGTVMVVPMPGGVHRLVGITPSDRTAVPRHIWPSATVPDGYSSRETPRTSTSRRAAWA